MQIPPRVLVGFEPECGSDGNIIVEFVDSCGDDSPAPRRATRKPRRSIRVSLAGELTVPELVGRLAAIGAERYHVDYSRQQITYYLANEDSQVVTAAP